MPPLEDLAELQPLEDRAKLRPFAEIVNGRASAVRFPGRADGCQRSVIRQLPFAVAIPRPSAVLPQNDASGIAGPPVAGMGHIGYHGQI